VALFFEMKLAIKRFFLVYLATYFLVGNLGISYTQSTCLFTGNKKYSFDKAVSCCSKNIKLNFNHANISTFSRAKCCSCDRYTLKFNFDQAGNKIKKHHVAYAVLTSPSLILLEWSGSSSFEKLSFYYSNHSPPPPLSTRLASLQAYLI
jgi:hypothetical protein